MARVVRIKKLWVVYDTLNDQILSPEDLDVLEDDIKKYVEEHSMPEDPVYSENDLISDLVYSDSLIFRNGMRLKTREYIVRLIEELVKN